VRSKLISTAFPLLIASAALASISCSSVAIAATTGKHFVTYKEPGRFTVSIPSGWKVADGAQGVKISDPDSSSFVRLTAFFAKGNVSSEQFLRALPELEANTLPNCQVTRVSKQDGQIDNAIAALSFGNGKKALAMCSIYDHSGMLYMIGASKGSFQEERPELVKILKSFSYLNGASTGRESLSGSGLQFKSFSDPNENAFSVEVPSGWTVKGGMYRKAQVDVRPELLIQSPDGKVGIRIGDRNLPPFIEPNRMLELGGFHVGSTYSPGYGVNLLVEPYIAGEQFASTYASNHLKQSYQNVRIVESKDRSDLTDQLNEVYSQLGNVKLTAGSAALTAERNGTPYEGYYLAGTLESSMGEQGMWVAQFLDGYMAPRGRTSEAEEVLKHALETYRIQSSWANMQQGIAMNTSEIVRKTGEAVSKSLMDTFWTQTHAQDENFRKWDNYIRGQVDVYDPYTHETWKAEAGHNYYWGRTGTNRAIGTDTYVRPNTNFDELIQF
jgi:hypothetical protein